MSTVETLHPTSAVEAVLAPAATAAAQDERSPSPISHVRKLKRTSRKVIMESSSEENDTDDVPMKEASASAPETNVVRTPSPPPAVHNEEPAVAVSSPPRESADVDVVPDNENNDELGSDEEHESRKRKKKHKKKHKKDKKKKRRKHKHGDGGGDDANDKLRKKMLRYVAEAEGESVDDEEEEDDDDGNDEMSEEGADMVDDDDKPVYANGASHSGSSVEADCADSLGSDEQTGLKRAKASSKKGKKVVAAADGDGGDAATDVAPLVHWPDDADADAVTFSAYLMFISTLPNKNEILCAVMFDTVPANLEAMLNAMLFSYEPSPPVDDHRKHLSELWRRFIHDEEVNPFHKHVHFCNAAYSTLWHKVSDNVSASPESRASFARSLQQTRRDYGSRLQPTAMLQRHWLYCKVSGQDVEQMRCGVGAYRVRLRCRQSHLMGVTAADFALSAVKPTEALSGKMCEPVTVLDARDKAAKALCLATAFERVHVYHDGIMSEFFKRGNIDEHTSDRNVNCFGGFPLDYCVAADFELLGMALGSDALLPQTAYEVAVEARRVYAFCEPFPANFADTTDMQFVAVRKRNASANLTTSANHAKRLAEKMMQQNVYKKTVFNVNYAVRIMKPHYLDPWFYIMSSNSKSHNNITVNEALAKPSTASASNQPLCTSEWLPQSAALHWLCSQENCGKGFNTRFVASVRNAFAVADNSSGGGGGSSGANNRSLSFKFVRQAMRTHAELLDDLRSERAFNDLPEDVMSWTEYRVRRISDDTGYRAVMVRRFLMWFADAFVEEDDKYTLAVRALGLLAVNVLRASSQEGLLTAQMYLAQPLVPYLVLFDDCLRKCIFRVQSGLQNVFLPWMRMERTRAWEVLLQKLDLVVEESAKDVVAVDSLAEAAAAVALKKTRDDYDFIATMVLRDLFDCVVQHIGELKRARLAGERSMPVTFDAQRQATNSRYANALRARFGDKRAYTLRAEHFERIVNVEQSPVRIVRSDSGNEMLLVDTLDYECERALRSIVLEVGHTMPLFDGKWRLQIEDGNAAVVPPPVSERHTIEDAVDVAAQLAESEVSQVNTTGDTTKKNSGRIVLLRSDDGNELTRLMNEELYDDIEHCRKPVLGARTPPMLLVLVHDDKECTKALSMLGAWYGEQRAADEIGVTYAVFTLEQLLTIGPARFSMNMPSFAHLPEKKWGSYVTALLVFNAHRFTYDEITLALACLCGVERCGPERLRPLRRMADADLRHFVHSFRVKNGRAPNQDEINWEEEQRLSAYTRQMRDLAEHFSENYLNGDEQSHWRNGARVRWIFAGVAYQRPAVDERCPMPGGNWFEDLYFANVARAEQFIRVREHYTGLAKQLAHYENALRALCVPPNDMHPATKRAQAIRDAQVMYVNTHRNEAQKEAVRRKHRERELLYKKEENALKARKKSQQSLFSFYSPVEHAQHGKGSSDSPHEVRTLCAKWSSFELPYVPPRMATTNFKNDFAYEPRNACDSTTEYASAHNMHVECDFLIIGAEEALVNTVGNGAAHSARSSFASGGASRRADLHYAIDLLGCGRSFLVELLARLRTGETGCIIVGDTRQTFYRSALVPHGSRKTCVLWQAMDANIRMEGCALLDADYLEANEKALFAGTELKELRFRPYTACLQSASVFLWRRDYQLLHAQYTAHDAQ